jgi:hypothetical protein
VTRIGEPTWLLRNWASQCDEIPRPISPEVVELTEALALADDQVAQGYDLRCRQAPGVGASDDAVCGY